MKNTKLNIILKLRNVLPLDDVPEACPSLTSRMGMDDDKTCNWILKYLFPSTAASCFFSPNLTGGEGSIL